MIRKKQRTFNKRNSRIYHMVCGLIILTIFALSLGYSTFSQKLLIDGIRLVVRIEADIRITGLSLSNDGNFDRHNATSLWEEYNVSNMYATINLPEIDSQVKYKVQITNFGNADMGILNITGLPEDLEYVIEGYNLKDKICVEDQCHLGVQKDIYITIKYKEGTKIPNDTNFIINLDFDFRPFHKITYSDFEIDTSKYPQEIIDGDSFKMLLTKPFPIGAKPFQEGMAIDYLFENDTLIVNNVTDDLLIKSNYIQSIEDLVTLSNYVKEGKTYKGVTFTLDKDLDFQDEKSYRNANRTDFEDINSVSGTEKLLSELTNESGTGFPSIGNYIHHFQGNLDGNNHTIDNLYIHIYSNGGHPETTVASLFGFITDGEIKNLTVKGNTFTDETANIGGIISYASNISLDNIHNYINITSKGTGYSVGGLIGSVGNDNIGLLGDNIRISNCSNHGTLQGGNHGGGLVGAIADKSHLFVNNSYNAGDVKNSIITNAGILALNNGNCYINNSYNIGHISSNGAGTSDGVVSLGGLMAANYGTAFVINSYNRGIVEYNGTKAKGGSIAGLIGLVQGGGHILNSYNIGTIKDTTNRSYIGGIGNTVTWNNPVHKQIYNAYNAGTITGGNTRYQIGYQYSGSLNDVFYKSGTGVNSSNSSGATEISDANMKLDANNANSLAYKLNNGMKDINLTDIQADLINHGYNSNYFELSLNSWIIDSETGYPTLK